MSILCKRLTIKIQTIFTLFSSYCVVEQYPIIHTTGMPFMAFEEKLECLNKLKMYW